MYYIVNLETRAVLTYRDGSRLTYASEDLARSHCASVQELLGVPCAVQHIASPGIDALRRETAPWFARR